MNIIEVDRRGNVALLRMRAGKANAISSTTRNGH
jgi:hypothetical protein